MTHLVTLLALLQPAASATGGGGGGGDGGAGAAGPAGCAGGGGFNMGFLAIMFLVMYFLLIRPQQKRQKEHDAMLKALTKGSLVRTTGGIRGEIVDLDEAEVTLKIADKTKINVLRSHVAGPVGSPEGDEEEKS